MAAAPALKEWLEECRLECMSLHAHLAAARTVSVVVLMVVVVVVVVVEALSQAISML
jgi:hypothetical protein